MPSNKLSARETDSPFLPENPSRRQFLTASGAVALSACLGTLAARADTAGDLKTKKLKIGIVGLGNRGSGAVRDVLGADPNVVIWSVGDVNEETTGQNKSKLKQTYGERIDCEERTFIGYDSFEKVLNSGIDIIMLATPPAFRPAQVRKSFEKGVHVFAEKPWCVDAPGLRMVESAVKAGNEKGFSFLTGLVWRHTEAAKKIYETALSGEIGDILTATGYYCLWQGMEKNSLEPAKLKTLHEHNGFKRWFSFRELGGDWIMEQFIHSVDKLGWAMNDDVPERCYGNGGRPLNGSPGNTTEFINITYEYQDGRRALLNGSHMSRFRTIHDEIFATKGRTKLSNGRSFIEKEGKRIFEADTVALGYELEHVTFLEHIRAGKVYSDLKPSYNTHLLALMGRMATQTGQEIYPEDVLESDEAYFDSEKKWDYDTPFETMPYPSPLNS
ncbi:Gfo/Idh/MocA family oxidoreductase [Luteolibacter algae]|uniref:Gfo/Idh/MocA family oxidoreductase n=1 Tax=Luteolibacter algae TaxID=454151 RepID=A0ABW5D788_9BACT